MPEPPDRAAPPVGAGWLNGSCILFRVDALAESACSTTASSSSTRTPTSDCDSTGPDGARRSRVQAGMVHLEHQTVLAPALNSVMARQMLSSQWLYVRKHAGGAGPRRSQRLSRDPPYAGCPRSRSLEGRPRSDGPEAAMDLIASPSTSVRVPTAARASWLGDRAGHPRTLAGLPTMIISRPVASKDFVTTAPAPTVAPRGTVQWTIVTRAPVYTPSSRTSTRGSRLGEP